MQRVVSALWATEVFVAVGLGGRPGAAVAVAVAAGGDVVEAVASVVNQMKGKTTAVTANATAETTDAESPSHWVVSSSSGPIRIVTNFPSCPLLRLCMNRPMYALVPHITAAAASRFREAPKFRT